MATTKRKLRNCRPKAAFGADGAVMAAAIFAQLANDTVNTILSVNQAKQNAEATRNAARTQADAIRQQATTQSQAMRQTNENNSKLQEQLISSNKDLYGEQTDVLKDMNTNIMLAQGKQNSEERKAASKLVVKKGGNIKRRLRNYKPQYMSIHGNLPFVVTDGGFAQFMGNTPEGYDLYQLRGNDHEHYHKTRGGKYKSGVGVKFATGGKAPITVEGEGNQHSFMGELMLVTPDDAMFISKHSIKGFNPTKAVLAGVNPVVAFNTQENLKHNNNPRKRNYIAKNGLDVYYQQPDLARDNVNIRSRNLTSQNQEEIINNGYNILDGQLNQTDLSRTNVARAKKGCSLKRVKAGLGKWWKGQNDVQKIGWLGLGANTLGAVASTIGNVVGSQWVRNANNDAANLMSGAYKDAGTTMADAYRNLKGIDASIINDADYSYNPAVATIRTARVNKNAELADIQRGRMAAKRLGRRSTLSSAKRNILDEQIDVKADAARSNVYQQKANEEEQIKQENAKLLNYMSMQNAEQALEAKKMKNAALLDIAKYNTDITNQGILGAADAESSALLGSAGIWSDTYKSNAQSKSNALNNSIATWNNALQSGIGTYSNLYQAMLYADKDVLKAKGLLKNDNAGENNFDETNTNKQANKNSQPFIDIPDSFNEEIIGKLNNRKKKLASVTPVSIFNSNYQPFVTFGNGRYL